MTAGQPGLYLGVSSGTSVDGIDAALVRFSVDGRLEETVATATTSMCRQLTDAIRQTGPHTPLHQLYDLDHQLGDAFGEAAQSLLDQTPAGERVVAIGSHGQTVWHHDNGTQTRSMQIGDPNRIAAQTHTPVVADFRRRDLAEGGHGAPLAPAFHHHLLASMNESRAVLNLGGIANITLLPSLGAVTGFDTGPANTLIDRWIAHHRGQTHDERGRWAASGQIDYELLKRMRADPYFFRPPPKSTGPEYFSLEWLAGHLTSAGAPADIQATLTELTAVSIADAVAHHAQSVCPLSRLLLCGGGVHNTYLVERIRHHCSPTLELTTTAALGIDPDFVEATAFAWLAWAHLARFPGNLPTVTGAHRPAVLGGLYGPN